MKYIFNDRQMQKMAILIGGVISILGGACTTRQQPDLEELCGRWQSVSEKPDIGIYKDGKAYKLVLFAKRGLVKKEKLESYRIQQEDGFYFIDTGFHIDMRYSSENGVLTFSTNGDYIRKPQWDESQP